MSERETLEKLVDEYERVVMERSLISVFNSEAKARNATKHADIRSRLLAALLREDEGERYEGNAYRDNGALGFVRWSFWENPDGPGLGCVRATLILRAPQPREELRP